MRIVVSLIFSLLGLVSYVYTETCPPAEDIFPMTCKEQSNGDIFVECADDSSLLLQGLRETVKGLHGKKDVRLKLIQLNLGKLPADVFKSIGVKNLEIYNCKLTALSGDGQPGLLGLEDTLEGLTIERSITDHIPIKVHLGHLKKLTILDLSENIIPELGKDWFDGGSASLEILMLYKNNIKRIGSTSFANFTNLKYFFLVDNAVSVIQRSMFPNPANQLEELEMEYNAISNIPEGMFSNMPALESVSFLGNNISRLELHTWYGIWPQLNSVNVGSNPIICDNHMNWIRFKENFKLFGSCQSPEKFKWKNIREFIEQELS